MLVPQIHGKSPTAIAAISTRDQLLGFLFSVLFFCTKAETADWDWFSNWLQGGSGGEGERERKHKLSLIGMFAKYCTKVPQ